MPSNPQPKQRKRYAAKVNALKQAVNGLAAMSIDSAPHQASKRKNKKRSNKKQKGLSVLNSIAQVERNLTKPAMNVNKGIHPYVKCRIDPFSASGGEGIPDGGNSNYIVIDSCVVNHIVDADNSGFIIQTLGLVPVGACLVPLGNSGTMSGITVDGVGVRVPANNGRDLHPLGIPAQYTSSQSYPGNFHEDPYESTGVRIVAVQYKLTYTGTPLSASGTYVVTPNTFTFSKAGICGPAGSTECPQAHWYDASGTAYPVRKNTAVWYCDGSIEPTAYIKDSKLSRIDRTLVLTPRHKSTNFAICPTSGQLPLLTTMDSNLASIENLFVAKNQAYPSIGIYAYDNDWQHFQVVVSGYAPGSSFTLETAYCYEYNIANASPFTPLTKKASPLNESAVKSAQAAVNSMATGGPR